MLFSSSCEYGIRALIHLSLKEGEGPALVRDIAEGENIPRHYLAKILQQLAGHGFVRSTKGPGGGFALSRDPKAITVQEIVNVLEPGQATRRCVLGLDDCNDEASCPLHDAWCELRDRFFVTLETMTLQDMAELIKRKRLKTEA